MNPIPSLNIAALMGVSPEGITWPGGIDADGQSAFGLVLKDVLESYGPIQVAVPSGQAAQKNGSDPIPLMPAGTVTRPVAQTSSNNEASSRWMDARPVPARVFRAEIAGETSGGAETAIPVIVVIAGNGQDARDGMNALLVTAPGQNDQVAQLVGEGDDTTLNILEEIVADSDLAAIFAVIAPLGSDTTNVSTGLAAGSGSAEAMTVALPMPLPPVQENDPVTYASTDAPVSDTADNLPSYEKTASATPQNYAVQTVEVIPIRLEMPVGDAPSLSGKLPVSTGEISNSQQEPDGQPHIQLTLHLTVSTRDVPVTADTAPETGQAEGLPASKETPVNRVDVTAGIPAETNVVDTGGDSLRLMTYMKSDGTIELVIDRQAISESSDRIPTGPVAESSAPETTVSAIPGQPILISVADESAADTDTAPDVHKVAFSDDTANETVPRSIDIHAPAPAGTPKTAPSSSPVPEVLHDDMAAFVEQPPEHADVVQADTGTRPTDTVIADDSSLLTPPRAYEGNDAGSGRGVPVNGRSPHTIDHMATDIQRSGRGGIGIGHDMAVPVEPVSEPVAADIPDISADTVDPYSPSDHITTQDSSNEPSIQTASGQNSAAATISHETEKIASGRGASQAAVPMPPARETSESTLPVSDTPVQSQLPSEATSAPVTETDTMVQALAGDPVEPVHPAGDHAASDRTVSTSGATGKTLPQNTAAGTTRQYVHPRVADSVQTSEYLPSEGNKAGAGSVTEPVSEPLTIDTSLPAEAPYRDEPGNDTTASVDRSMTEPVREQRHSEPVRLVRPMHSSMQAVPVDNGDMTVESGHVRTDVPADGIQYATDDGAEKPVPSEQIGETVIQASPVAAEVQAAAPGNERDNHKSWKERRIGHSRAAAPAVNVRPRNEAQTLAAKQSVPSGTRAAATSVTFADIASNAAHQAADDAVLPDTGANSAPQSDETAAFGIEHTNARESATVHRFTVPLSGRAPVDSDKVAQAIIRHARIMIRQGESSARIQLEPPHLGKLQLDIVTEHSKVTGKITVETVEVRDIVQNNLSLLRDSLAQNGLKVESFDVQVGHNGGTDSWANMENARHQVGNRTGNRQNNSVHSVSPDPIVGTSPGIRRGSPGYSKIFDRWI